MILQHSKEAYTISTARLLERAAYYGFRTFIVLFMIQELKMDQTEALSIYLYFTIAVYLFGIVGGALGDFVLGNKNAFIIGCTIQATGIFTLYVKPESTIYISLGLVAFGTALISTNIITLFGKQYLNNKNLLNSGYNLFYGFVTLGTFLGILIVSFGNNILDYKLCIPITGAFSIAGAVVLFIIQPVPQVKRESKPKIKVMPIVMLVVITLVVGVFWSLFDVISGNQVGLLQQMSPQVSNGYNWGWFIDLSTYSTIGFCLLGFVLWSYKKMKSSYQLAAGLVIGLIGWAILLQVSEDDPQGAMPLFIMSALLLSIAEVLIMPASLALYVKLTNPKFTATLYAVAATAIFAITRFVPPWFEKQEQLTTLESAVLFTITCLAILGLIVFLVGVFTPEKPSQVVFKEPDISNDELLDQ